MSQTSLAMIVAASENNVIGREGDLPWRISSDLKRFKSLTMGHHLIMGRKTFESIGRLLPGRTTVIVTRNKNFRFDGAVVVHSIEDALENAGVDESPFLVGGAELYRVGLPLVNKLYLTRVHAKIEGDTLLPEMDWSDWDLVAKESFDADDKNEYRYSFEDYVRVGVPLQ